MSTADSPSPLNVRNLASLREIFLERMPDFGDFSERSGTYWTEEREYKDELCVIARATLTPSLFADDSPSNTPVVVAGVRHILLGNLKSINRPQNLASWRYTDFLRHMSASEADTFVRALRVLLFGTASGSERVGAFTAATWPMQQRISGGNPYAQARLIPTLFLMLLNPDDNIAVRTDMFKRAASQLLGRRLLRSALFSTEEYGDVLHLAREVRRAFESWAWCPRDMIDVHSFLWIATRDVYSEAELEEKEDN